MKSIESISEIINNYDTFLIDQWGVIHNGNIGFRNAIEALNLLKEKNKNLIIISNSSKRKASSIDNLIKLNFNKNHFKEVLTSGELIWNKIFYQSFKELYQKKCLHIHDQTKEDGLKFREGLDNITFIDDIEEADFVLACTPYKNSKPIDYVPLLEKAIKNKMVIYCANPDFETIDSNDNSTFCIGLICDLYKQMGGTVMIKGKPEIDIYIESTKKIDIKKSRTIAIGDSLFHDIAGANNFNIDSALVLSGIHKNVKNIKQFVEINKISPTYLINYFCL